MNVAEIPHVFCNNL